MKIIQILPLFLGFIFVANQAKAAKEIEILISNNPPLICMANGELDCIAGNLIKAAAKAGGFTLKVNDVPLARAKEIMETNPNALFAASGRNEFSENLYNWFFQVYTDDVFIFTLGDKKINSDADIAKLGKINVRRGSPFGAYLDKRGYASKITETNEWTQGAQMLESGRVDGMCLTGIVGLKNIVELQKIPAAQVNKYKVGEMAWFLNAKLRGTPSPDLLEFKKFLEAEKAKPPFQEALKKYGVRG